MTAGKLRIELGQYVEAIQVYQNLLQINPENKLYYMKLSEAERHKKPEETLLMLEHYESVFPRALAPKRLQLNYAVGEKFKELVDKYLRRGNFLFYNSRLLIKKI